MGNTVAGFQSHWRFLWGDLPEQAKQCLVRIAECPGVLLSWRQKCPAGFCMDSPGRSLTPCPAGKIEAESQQWPKQNQFFVTVVFLLPAWESWLQLVCIIHCSDSFSWCSLNIACDCSWLRRRQSFSAYTRWRDVQTHFLFKLWAVGISSSPSKSTWHDLGFFLIKLLLSFLCSGY